MSSTDLVVLAGSAGEAPKPQIVGLRLAENFMQRWFLLLLPVVIMGGIGVLIAQRMPDEYLGSATLSTSANPLVGAQEVRGLTGRSQESAAAATARVVNERLGTDRFTAGVAERAGLADAVDNGLLSFTDIQSRVSLVPIGDSLVDIEARWSDPETTLRLIEATLAEYRSVLQSTVSGDAEWAVQFYENRRTEAVANAEIASEELNAFIAELPGQFVLPRSDELELQRLNDRLTAAHATIDDTESAIEDARLTVVRARSEAGGSIQIIDPPDSTFEPQSSLIDKAIVLVGFLLLGLLAAIVMLIASTYLDRSVRSAADIEAAGGGVTVAAVPVIKSLRPRSGARRAFEALGNAPGRMFGRSQQAA